MTGARSDSRTWLTAVLTAGLALAGCHGAPARPEPTAQEWEHATEEKAAPAAKKVVFAPPRLVAPPDGETFTQARLAADHEVIVFAWDWTLPEGGPGPETGSARRGYEYAFELATDRNFTGLVRTAAVARNTVALRFALPGHYFWRVRAGETVSSNVHALTIDADER